MDHLLPLLMEPATRIERVTCGLRIAINRTPVEKINHLVVQRKVERGKVYAIPQPDATEIPGPKK